MKLEMENTALKKSINEALEKTPKEVIKEIVV